MISTEFISYAVSPYTCEGLRRLAAVQSSPFRSRSDFPFTFIFKKWQKKGEDTAYTHLLSIFI